MNFRPGSLARLSVCHSRSCGFSEVWPTIGALLVALYVVWWVLVGIRDLRR